jgi:hypothetical protein
MIEVLQTATGGPICECRRKPRDQWWDVHTERQNQRWALSGNLLAEEGNAVFDERPTRGAGKRSGGRSTSAEAHEDVREEAPPGIKINLL